MHPNTNGFNRNKAVGQTGNLTNVTSTVDPNLSSTNPEISPRGILVERGVEIEISDWESGRELVGKSNEA